MQLADYVNRSRIVNWNSASALYSSRDRPNVVIKAV